MKQRLGRIAIAAACTLLAACGNDSGGSQSDELPPQLSATTLGEQTVLEVSEYLSAPPYAGADKENGARLVLMCKSCHSFDKGGPNMIGPALFDVFSRRVGGQDGFAYSPAMQEADFAWTPRALDAWLARPGPFLPGNRMPFAGVMRAEDRNDLIAYLLEATSDQKASAQ